MLGARQRRLLRQAVCGSVKDSVAFCLVDVAHRAAIYGNSVYELGPVGLRPFATLHVTGAVATTMIRHALARIQRTLDDPDVTLEDKLATCIITERAVMVTVGSMLGGGLGRAGRGRRIGARTRTDGAWPASWVIS